MSYIKAKSVLPDELIKELQKYVQGQTIYIPKEKNNYEEWGKSSGGRNRIDQRNADIQNGFNRGMTITQLADDYFLSPDTIKKIVYSRK
ncbi:CD3324 family protein [Pontibacillus marinus]|nr:CD3324 family protein [Pontibacillus marinus]